MATVRPSKKGLDAALRKIKKDWGDEAISTCDTDVKYEAIPTGYDDLDAVLTKGAHGMFLGGIIELFGSEGSGKTSLALRTVAQAQKMGYPCVWIDAEAGFSADLAIINGVDPKFLVMPELALIKDKDSETPEYCFLNAKKILALAYDYIATNQFALVVIDSVAGLMPERLSNQDKFDPDKTGVAEVSSAMSEGLKRCAQICRGTKTSLILINQLRDQPGKMFQDPYHTPGGRAIKFFARHRLSVEKVHGTQGLVTVINPDTKREEIIGHWARVKIVKNKVAPPVPPDLQIDIPIYYKKYDPDLAEICYNLARSLNVIRIRNDVLIWKYNDQELYNNIGQADLLHFIRENKLEPLLAYQCVEATKSERNKSLKSPIKAPKVVLELAEKYICNSNTQDFNNILQKNESKEVNTKSRSKSNAE